MNKIRKLSFSINGLLILLFTLIINIPLFPQNRGNWSFASPSAKNLMFTKPMNSGGTSQIGLSSVGGISFDKEAVPVAGLDVNNLTINYNPSNPDGQRLVLSINGTNVSAPLYDWMLLPIARYSSSPYYACFTYFGELADKNLEKTILDNDGRILNYHPELLNNLLGLRIGDMDLLMMYDFTVVLPKSNGSFILGAGESIPDTIANAAGFNNFISLVNQTESSLQQSFRSYVITDYLQQVAFSVSNGQLNISGDPFYYCWRYNYDDPSYDPAAVQSGITNAYSKALQDALIINPSFDARNLYIDSLLSAAIRYKNRFNIYSAGTFVDLLNIDPAGSARRNFLEQYYTSDLYNMLISVETDMVSYTPEYLKEYSEAISRPDLLSQANPHVWNATRSLMKYAAFFRYVKDKFPVQWSGFTSQVENLICVPDAITPTAMYPRTNNIIKTALDNYFSSNPPSVNAGSDIAIGACNTSTTLNATGSGVYLSWKWTPDDGSLSNINISNPLIKKPNTGLTTYIVTVTDIKGKTASDSKVVTVDAAPTVDAPGDISFTQNLFPYTLATTSTGNQISYLWSPDNGSLNNIRIQSPQIVKPVTGSTKYKVLVTDNHGCTVSDSLIVYVDQTVSVEKTIDDPQFNIYPNPVSDFLRIDNAKTITRLKVFDETGRLAMNLENSSDNMIVATKDLLPGKYMVVMYTSNNKVYVRRIIRYRE